MVIKAENMTKIISIISFYLTSYSILFACSCPEVAPLNLEEYNNADAIFIGEIVKIEENEANYEKVLTFKVTKHLKSDTTYKEYQIRTADSGRSCGLEGKIGESWYILASKGQASVLSAGMCGRSLNLTELNDSSNSIYDWFDKLKTRFENDLAFIESMKRTP